MSLSPLGQHPLVRLVFTFSEAPAEERVWYYVPRVGERVELQDRAPMTVERVWWDETDNCVYVRLG